MGFFTYLFFLIPSVAVAYLLRTILRWPISKWVPTNASYWQRVISAVLRAFPFAFAFAPTLLMKRGLGVLIPASLYLFPELIGLPFRSHPLDADDKHNLSVAGTSLVAVWGIVAFILFVRQSLVADKKAANDPRAS